MEIGETIASNGAENLGVAVAPAPKLSNRQLKKCEMLIHRTFIKVFFFAG